MSPRFRPLLLLPAADNRMSWGASSTWLFEPHHCTYICKQLIIVQVSLDAQATLKVQLQDMDVLKEQVRNSNSNRQQLQQQAALIAELRLVCRPVFNQFRQLCLQDNM